jgi:DNA-binding transcriptional regulator of glucitol operon
VTGRRDPRRRSSGAGVGNLEGVLRLLVTPRWIGWTLFALVIVAVCGAMAYWQVIRAESPGGSLLNAGYAFQWPLFGVFFAALWWRMLRAEARALAAVRAEQEPAEHDPAEHEPAEPPARDVPVRAAPVDSPFGPRPVGVRPGGLDAGGAPAPGRARYNAMLAELAAREERPQQEKETDPS